MNIGPQLTVRRAFHRIGDTYGSIFDSEYLMGINPWDGLRLTVKPKPMDANKKNE